MRPAGVLGFRVDAGAGMAGGPKIISPCRGTAATGAGDAGGAP